MQQIHYKELQDTIHRLNSDNVFKDKDVVLFGFCNATEEAFKMLCDVGVSVKAILDNNPNKQGQIYKGTPISAPEEIMHIGEDSMVCIAARAYTSMKEQLISMGFDGEIIKLVDYDPYSEPSLDAAVVSQKRERLERGLQVLKGIKNSYADSFILVCPYYSLGDVVNALSYYPYFAENRNVKNTVVAVIGKSAAEIAYMYGYDSVKTLSWTSMTELVQALLWTRDCECYIAHNDKPYTVDLAKVLNIRRVNHEKIYCCGTYGLPITTKPVHPHRYRETDVISKIKLGKSVILSPYANSVVLLDDKLWEEITDYYKLQGYDVYTNVVGDEKPINGTMALTAKISEMIPIVEKAGTFIGIRSGLCDVIKYSNCDKYAFYPDTYYSDTRWKLIDVFELDGWTNIEMGEKMTWERIKERMQK